MAHAAEKELETSSDVFGNELGDVDVWDDDQTSDGDSNEAPPTRGTIKVVDKALSIIDGRPPAPTLLSPLKPPRTPSQCSRKTMIVKALLSTSPGSESDKFEGGLDRKQSYESGNTLPPMTPRTRMRKLGLQVSSPSCGEEEPASRPITAAEKRRLRHECFSLRTKNLEQDNDDTSFPKLGGKGLELSSTHTRTTAQMDSSLSSLSLCPSHFTSLSKGSHGDSGNSMDLKDLCQSQVSSGATNRQNKSSSTDMDFSDVKPKRNGVDDLARHIETVLQRSSDMKPPNLKPSRRGRKYHGDSVPESSAQANSQSHPPRPVSSPRTPRSTQKSSVAQGGIAMDGSTPRTDCESKLMSVGSGICDYDDDSYNRCSPSHPIRRSSPSPNRYSLTKTTDIQPNGSSSNLTTASQPRLPIRSRSDCQVQATRARKLPSQTKLPRRCVSDAYKRRLDALPPQRSPSPSIRRKDCIETKGHSRHRSSTPRRRIKHGQEIEQQNTLSLSSLEF
jgi:hypothetical protein